MKKLLAIFVIVTLLINTTPVYGATIADDFSTGLLEHWELEETSGNRTGSKNSTVLTDVGTVGYATGKQGNGADFEYSNSEYLTNATAVGSGVDDDLSFGFWIKPETIPVSPLFGQLFSYQIVDGVNSYFASLLLFRNGSANTIQILLIGATVVEIYYDHSMTAGNWYYIGFTVDKGTGYTLTINGSSVNTGTAPTKKTSSPPSGGSFLELAESHAGVTRYGRYFDGIIDEFSFWNTVISVANYSTIYNSGSGIAYPSVGGGAVNWGDGPKMIIW